ncbi:MAG: DUF421 domain-containing protein [Oscillospiraceae bacterium]|nr:DUF421 domain-containing protein [Oscillospiraceae bacterium]
MLTMLKIFINAVVIYGVLVLLLRLMGKRQLGDLELSELIVTVLVSQVAATPITDPDKPLWYGIVPVVTLLGMELALSFLMAKNVKFRAILAGQPALLIVHGRIDQGQMRRNRFTPDELAEALRNEGVLDMNAVDYAILETDGRLNVILAPENRPVTAGQMKLTQEDTGYPMIVINNGRVMENNLRLLGRDMNWLNAQLKAQGLKSPRQVYMMTTDVTGGIFLAPRESK